MENQNTLLWIVSIVAVVGIVAMVIAATRTGETMYASVSTTEGGNIAGQATSCAVVSELMQTKETEYKSNRCSVPGQPYDIVAYCDDLKADYDLLARTYRC